MLNLLKFLPALAWIVAAVALFRLAWFVTTSAQNNGVLEWLMGLIALFGGGGAVRMAWTEFQTARKTIASGQPYWIPPAPEPTLIGPTAGHHHPLKEAEIMHVKAVFDALDAAGLFSTSPDDRVLFIQQMEREGYDHDIGAMDVVKSTRWALTEHDLEMPGWVFTDEQVECYDSTIQSIASGVLALTGRPTACEVITVHRSASPDPSGTVEVPIDDSMVALTVTFHSKYTPDNLIEGIAKAAPLESEARLHWENLDMSQAIIAATETQIAEFNAAMQAIGDPFRFKPVA